MENTGPVPRTTQRLATVFSSRPREFISFLASSSKHRCGAENRQAECPYTYTNTASTLPRTLLKTLQGPRRVGRSAWGGVSMPGSVPGRTMPRALPCSPRPAAHPRWAHLGYSAVLQTLLQLQLIIHSGCQWPRNKRHRGSPSRKVLSRYQPWRSQDSREGQKPLPQNRHTQHNPLHTAPAHKQPNKPQSLQENVKGVSKTHTRQLLPTQGQKGHEQPVS